MEYTEIPVIEKDIKDQIPEMDDLEKINKLLINAERPIIIAGNGIKLGNCDNKFTKLVLNYSVGHVDFCKGDA